MKTLLTMSIVILIAMLIAYTGSEQSITVSTIPLFALSSLIIFLIQWLVFVPSFLKQTEHFYDLTGSLTYISIIAFTSYFGTKSPVQILLGILVVIWAVRLGSFLFLRVRKNNGDSRFEKKDRFGWFLIAWTVQGLWIFLTSAAALTVICTEDISPPNIFTIIGLLVWIFGFGFEVISDRQKSIFRNDATNKGRFIRTGLWKYSRHPNYFGEIVLWCGIAIICLPHLEGLGYYSLISPLFVYILLTRISGVTLLEEQGKKRWGNDSDYQDYVQKTPSLVPTFLNIRHYLRS